MKKQRKTQRTRTRNNDAEQQHMETYEAVIGQQSTDTALIKTMTIVSILGIIGGLACLYLLLGTGVMDGYFQTKLQENTIYASASQNHDSTSAVATQDEDDDHTGITDNSDEPLSLDDLDELIDVSPSQILIDREDLIAYLDELSDKEFEVFIQTMAEVIHEYTDGDKELQAPITSDTHIDLVTLQEAYERAEEKYPNQINASKRISLINELNAIDYNYYVVEHGDTLGELSKSLEIPMGQFLEINGIHDADLIRIGEILLVPIEE